MVNLIKEFHPEIQGRVSLDRDALEKLLAIGAAVGCSDEDARPLIATIATNILSDPNIINALFNDVLDNARNYRPQPLASLLHR